MNQTEYKKDIIYRKLKDDILNGKLPPNTKLPKELDFAKELGVGKITLRSALDRLEKEGLIARLPSRGTFVLENSKPLKSKILVITDNKTDSFESPNGYILPEIRHTASQMNLGLEICERSFIESLSHEELNKILQNKNIGGIIFLAQNFTGKEQIVAQLSSTGLPTILPHGSDHDTKVTGFASILIDQKDAWRDAIKHLCDKGHTHIATIAMKPNKIRGYTEPEHLELLQEYGARPETELMGYAPYDKEAVNKIVENWLSFENPPTAILCFSDFYAIHVYETLKRNKIRIPDDIAVMGCCGYPGGAFMSPPLSTVDFEYAKLGAMSVELAEKSEEWHSTEEKIAPPQILKLHKLQIRGSAEIKRVEKTILKELMNA